MRRIWKNEKGLAMTEYIIILCLVAVASIAIVKVMGKRIKTMFTNATTELNAIDSKSSTDTQETGN